MRVESHRGVVGGLAEGDGQVMVHDADGVVCPFQVAVSIVHDALPSKRPSAAPAILSHLAFSRVALAGQACDSENEMIRPGKSPGPII